ncbi:MAG: hypothetical protein AAB275_05610 [Deltaproteobacteria bacterium]
MKRYRLNLEMMIRNFYFFTIFAVIIGGITYFSIREIGKEVSVLKEGSLPLLVLSQEMQLNLEEIAIEAEGLLKVATEEEKAAHIEKIEKGKTAFKNSLGSGMRIVTGEEEERLKELESRSKSFFRLFDATEISQDDLNKKLFQVRASLNNFRGLSSQTIEDKFTASQAATGRAITIVIVLTLCAIAGMIGLGLILSRAVGVPVSRETERLISDSKATEQIFAEISEGTKKQTDVVQTATGELEDMIINIIQGKISISVDKQSEIARVFADFLKNFVERTTVEIAMGMMSISQQSKDARTGVEDFVREISTVEANIRAQEGVISGMVDALKSIVEANNEIKGKARSSTDAADKATVQAHFGQEKIETISEQLQEIRKASVGVKEITDSLAKFTEGIKILALNMSLKVEDIKDDTGKTYGFEAMSAKVQKLAEDVEGLLESSKSMLIPTILGIEKVSIDAGQARELIAEVVRSIKMADDQSKAISVQIDKQAANVDRVEIEAENLRSLAHKTTLAVEAQGALSRDVDTLLKDSETLIDSVNAQTQEASEGARRVNQMMGQLKQTLASIEDGTGELTEKSSQISDMFDSIKGLAVKNMNGAEKLAGVTASIREVSRRLSEVVKGEAV